MQTYTILNRDGGVIERGLTAEQAARSILTYDGHEYEVRQNMAGAYVLWCSRASRNSGGGTGGMTSTVICADTEANIWPQVIARAEWWDNQECHTDEAYAAYVRDIESDNESPYPLADPDRERFNCRQ